MTKNELIKEQIRLETVIIQLKKQAPKKTYTVIDNDGKPETIMAHGFNYDTDYANFWVHPWDNVAIFYKPISIKQTKEEDDKEIL